MKIRLLSAATALLLMFPAVALAASKNSGSITLASSTMIGNTQLQAGQYKVEWSGSGPNVQTRFLKDNKTVATAPATLEHQPSPYESAVDVRTLNHTQVLQNIYWRHVTLKFGHAG